MPAPMMTTRVRAGNWSEPEPGRGARSDSGMQDGVLAKLDERLELCLDARVDAGIRVVRQELLPFLVRAPARGTRAHPLPAVVVLGRGDPGPVEAGSVVTHRVLRPEMVASGADLPDPIHGEALIVEGDAFGEDPLEHPQGFDVDDEFFVGGENRALQPAGGVKH